MDDKQSSASSSAGRQPLRPEEATVAIEGATSAEDRLHCLRTIFPRFLEGLPDGGLIMCHPGFVDSELKRLDPLTHLREREYEFFMSDDFPELLQAHHVALGRPPGEAEAVAAL